MLRKVVLTTGSTTGIGLGIARRLAENGCSVVVTGIGDKKSIDSLIADMRGIGMMYGSLYPVHTYHRHKKVYPGTSYNPLK